MALSRSPAFSSQYGKLHSAYVHPQQGCVSMNLLSNCREVSYLAYQYNNALRLQPSEMWRYPIHLRQKPRSRGSWFSASWQWRFCVRLRYGQNRCACRLSILCYKLFIICGSNNDAVGISLSNT